MSPSAIVLIFAVSIFTVATMIWDARFKKIPNKLTIPMFFAGWVFQIGMSIMYGWHHLGSAALGFLIGFGILFVLWFIGGGVGGDVKLMGALSVWLGYKMTLGVMLVSTILVLISTVGVVIWSIASRGYKGTKKQYLGTGKTAAGKKPVAETSEDKLKRRVMTYAGPVGLATWIVLAWNYPQLNQMADADEAAPAQVESQPADIEE